MTKIGIFRCKNNEMKCPLTNCFRSLYERKEGFSQYDNPQLAGVFTLQESEKDNLSLAEIFKAKGVEVIHFVTCSFSRKDEHKTWHVGNGFYEDVDDLARKIVRQTGLPCIKGTAHLPKEYIIETFN